MVAVQPPETRYARSADGVHIAYQVVGDGDVDLVFIPGFVSHLELAWELPLMATFLERLSRIGRLIAFDKRGTGLSDPVPPAELPTLEQRMDDLRAVMDAAGSARAFVIGVSEGGPMAALFAATYPERVLGLVLAASTARFRWAEDAPWGWTDRYIEAGLENMERTWGTGAVMSMLSAAAMEDPVMAASAGRFERAAASPGATRAIVEMVANTDVRSVLPAITVPTLVLHRVGDRLIPVEAARDLAARVPGARLVELPGSDHAFFASEDRESFLGEIEEFTTGERGESTSERVLATVLFTDIVDSTKQAAEMGDRRWKEVLDAHDSMVARQLARFRGRSVKHTGDGHLASFDGPARAIRCALATREGARALGLSTRTGIHTGECEERGDDLAGIAVITAARVMALAGPDEVVVSQTVRDLVAGSGLQFDERGDHELKGVPGRWTVWAATD